MSSDCPQWPGYLKCRDRNVCKESLLMVAVSVCALKWGVWVRPGKCTRYRVFLSYYVCIYMHIIRPGRVSFSSFDLPTFLNCGLPGAAVAPVFSSLKLRRVWNGCSLSEHPVFIKPGIPLCCSPEAICEAHEHLHVKDTLIILLCWVTGLGLRRPWQKLAEQAPQTWWVDGEHSRK